MKRLVLVFGVAFAFCSTAMAADIAISTQAGWFGQAAADREMQEIVDNVTGASVELFPADQQAALADWVVAHTGDGVSDLLILCGNFPDTIYPPGNAQPDGSLAELFLDDGNTIINTGDYMFYVNSGGTNNNAAGGLENMMDIPGISMWDDNTSVAVTAEGAAVAPTLVDFQTDRPFHLNELQGGWYPELVLAQNAAGTRADPVIVANTATGGRLGIFYQTASQDDDPRGEVISEWINNWYLTTGDVLNLSSSPNPADGAIEVDTGMLMWTAGHAAVSHIVYLSEDATIDETDMMIETDMAAVTVDLAPGTTYYWRVDEVDADGNITEGDLWSFATIALEAHFPVPADGAVWQALDTTLSWTPGKVVVMHDVYFGTDEAAVAAGDMSTSKGMMITPEYDPGPLAPDTTYYWRVDEFTPTGTVAGPVWSFTTLDPDVADNPDPADGAVDVALLPVLTWTAGETAVQHDVYLGRDEALVAAGDASVLASQQADIGFTPAEPLERGVTYYWKVDVTTADGKIHLGFVYSFRTEDPHTENWAMGIQGTTAPDYLDTYVENGAYDIGEFSGDITYEFVVKSNPDETQTSMALIGRHGHGPTTVALKYEQWSNTGNYGATVFGVMDYDYGVANAPGEYTHLVFVSSEDAAATELYVNGEPVGSVPTAITLAGVVGIGRAIQDPEGISFIDDFDGDIFGVAIYDRALSGDEIAGNAEKYFQLIPIVDPGLKVYFNFNIEALSGPMVNDLSGYGNHGTMEDDPILVLGKSGQALAFDGSRVAIPASSSLTPDLFQGSFALSAWINPTRAGNTWQQVFRSFKADDTSNDTLFINNDGRLSWRARVGGAWAGGMCETASDVVPADEWTHAAVVGDRTNFRIYVNGIVSQESAFQITDGTNAVYYIGGDPGTAGESYAGMVDDLRIYGRVLTDAEILDMVTPAPSDIAFYVGAPNVDGWYDVATMTADVETIIAETGHLFGDIQKFDDDQLDAFGAWVDERTFDGKMDILWLNGCVPSVLYPYPNLEPDGSRIEEWLDGGNMIINVGDWFAYCSYEGGSRQPDNGPNGAANILDLSSGIIVSADNTTLTVTSTGHAYLPSLGDSVITYRPIVLSTVVAPWEVAAVFASLDGTESAAQGDPVVIHNTETDAYVAFVNQSSGSGPPGWLDDRGLTCAEFINNWVTANTGVEEPAPLFFEDFESYAAGTTLQDVGGWAGWDGDAGASAPVSDAFAFSGVNSVEIIGSADLVQTFAVDGGQCVFSAMQYIPSGTTGTTWFILLNQYPADKDWSVQLQFNLDTGVIGSSYDGSVAAPIVYDQWVEVKCAIDLDNNTIEEFYNGELLSTRQWDDSGHTTLQAVDLYGNGASSVYYDDIVIK